VDTVTAFFEWPDGERRWRVPFDEIGHGRPLLCLPAPSTISTRQEMRSLAELLAGNRRVVLVDWPGLGDADRAPIRYRAPLFSRFLAAFAERFTEPIDVVVAGHGACYLLGVAQDAPSRFRRLALLAPTWRGPLPTAMGPHPQAWSAAESLLRAPLVGRILYAVNSSRPFIHWMMRRHVYAEPAHITGALLDARVHIAHRSNARFAAAAFVTGGLDAFRSRSRFLDAARACPVPLFVAIGMSTPPKSLAEMQALAALPNVRSRTLPGSLAFYDEYPDETAASIDDFLEMASNGSRSLPLEPDRESHPQQR
jgi:pimeloyl-ACP methyl ester carboxylesterase